MPSETQEARVREWTLVQERGYEARVFPAGRTDLREYAAVVPVLSKEDVEARLNVLGRYAYPADDLWGQGYGAAIKDVCDSLGISLPTPGDAG